MSQRAAGEPEPVQDARLLAAAARVNFAEPFTWLFEDGAVDGSLVPPSDDPAEAAELFFNTVSWSYVHLRGRHRWTAGRARRGLRTLLAPGLEAGPLGSPGPAVT